MKLKNIHEKLMESIQQMLIDSKSGFPYYGNFNLFINFHENEKIPTCGVNVTTRGMQFYYNSGFLNKLSQKEVNFITLHEDFHLLFSHPKRTITGQYDPSLANVAQDMIINHVIWEDIPSSFVEIPKDENGRNMTLFVPKEYKGKLIFEELYDWLREKQDEHKKKKQQNQCQSCGGTGQKQKGDGGKGKSDPSGESGDQGDQEDQASNGSGTEPCPDCNGTGNKDGKGTPSYGPYGQDPKNENGTIDTHSLDQIFDNLEENQGQYMDVHMGDDLSQEARESLIKDAMDRLQARGLQSANIEQTLGKIQKKRKDYLKYIKRSVSNLVFGTRKTKTIVKPNRRGIKGLKGHRKIKNKINCILDTSGSMGSTFDRVLAYIYRNDIETNLIQCDADVKWIENIKNRHKLDSIKISGGGGTILQPAVNLVADKFNAYNTLIITDGYCDHLDLSILKGNVLIITIGAEVPISRSNGKIKQIKVDPEMN